METTRETLLKAAPARFYDWLETNSPKLLQLQSLRHKGSTYPQPRSCSMLPETRNCELRYHKQSQALNKLIYGLNVLKGMAGDSPRSLFPLERDPSRSGRPVPMKGLRKGRCPTDSQREPVTCSYLAPGFVSTSQPRFCAGVLRFPFEQGSLHIPFPLNGPSKVATLLDTASHFQLLGGESDPCEISHKETPYMAGPCSASAFGGNGVRGVRVSAALISSAGSKLGAEGEAEGAGAWRLGEHQAQCFQVDLAGLSLLT